MFGIFWFFIGVLRSGRHSIGFGAQFWFIPTSWEPRKTFPDPFQPILEKMGSTNCLNRQILDVFFCGILENICFGLEFWPEAWFYKHYYGGMPSGGSIFWKMTPPGFYKLHYGGIPSGGVIFLKNDAFFCRFIETKTTRNEISCRIHRLSRRDQFSRPVSRASGICAFRPLFDPG